MNDEWELSKENVLPVKRGRSASMLSEVLISKKQAVATESKREEEQQNDYFESQLSRFQDNPTELLNIYEIQFKWYRDHFPSDASRLLTLLEKCTFELKEESSCKNDTRFIKMWIEYADLVRAPGDIFAFMQSNKIGEKNALFWIAWAYVTEKSQNFKLTDQIFQKGIRKLAEPKDLLQKRYQQFQRRLARHYINMEEKGESTSGNAEESGSRKVLASLSRTSMKTGQRVVTDENNSAALLPQTNSNQNIPRPSIVPHGKSLLTNNKNKGFEIYSDVPTASVLSTHGSNTQQTESSQLAENVNWKTLSTQHAQSKENAGMPTKWSDAPLKPTVPLPERRPLAAPSFEIFVDDELRTLPAAAPITEDANKKSKPALSVRMQMDKESLSAAVDPLERHKMISKMSVDEQHVPTVTVSTTSTTGHAKNSSSDVQDKPTVSTTASLKKAPENSSKVQFAIFNDFESDTVPGHSTSMPSKKIPQAQPSAAATTKGFAIYVDDNLVANEEKLVVPTTSHKIAPSTDSRNKTVEAIELNALLDEIGIYDRDDSTINTRVARKDIDMMFCSPDEKNDDIYDETNSGAGTANHRPLLFTNESTTTGNTRLGIFNSDSAKYRGFSIGELSDIKEQSSTDHSSLFGILPSPTLGDIMKSGEERS